MATDSFTVDIAQLGAIQTDMDTIRSRLQNVDSKDDFDPSAIGHKALTSRLVSFANGWRDGRKTINEQLEGLSKSLSQVVANYEQAEAANKESLGGGGNGTGGQAKSTGADGSAPAGPAPGAGSSSADSNGPPSGAEASTPPSSSFRGGVAAAAAAGAVAAGRGDSGGPNSAPSGQPPASSGSGSPGSPPPPAPSGSVSPGSPPPPTSSGSVSPGSPRDEVGAPPPGVEPGVGGAGSTESSNAPADTDPPFSSNSSPGPVSLPDLNAQLVGVRDGLTTQIDRLEEEIAECADPKTRQDLVAIRDGLVEQRDFLDRITRPSAEWCLTADDVAGAKLGGMDSAPTAVVPAFKSRIESVPTPVGLNETPYGPSEVDSVGAAAPSPGSLDAAGGTDIVDEEARRSPTEQVSVGTALPPETESVLTALREAGVAPENIHLLGEPATYGAVAKAVEEGRAGAGASVGRNGRGMSASSSMLGMMIMSAVTTMARPTHRRSGGNDDG